MFLAQMIVWAAAFLIFFLTFMFRDFIVLVLLSFIGSTLVVHNFGFMVGKLPNFLTILDEIDFSRDYQVVR